MQDLRQKAEAELLSNILPFWLKYSIDHEYGGFRGRITGCLTFDRHAPKGLILNARILWTFSKAYSVYRDPAYLACARRAYEYLTSRFWDQEFGGLFWMLDFEGHPIDTKKRVYGQAFAIYALAEYAHASGEYDAMSTALRLAGLVEAAAHDPLRGGYFETCECDWTLAADQRLSEVDLDEKRSMNTHLHLLEAYATLLCVHDDPAVRLRLRELIDIFLHRIIDPITHHFILFFDERWRPRSRKISFGHDVEGSWLLCEAAEVLGDKAILSRIRKVAVEMAQAVYERGIDADGGLFYEADATGIIDPRKHWWPQAEAVVGFVNAAQLSGRSHFLRAAEQSWTFIEEHLIDHENGEWFSLAPRYEDATAEIEKVGPWKCPYHNSRACFEVIRRQDAGLRLPLARRR